MCVKTLIEPNGCCPVAMGAGLIGRVDNADGIWLQMDQYPPEAQKRGFGLHKSETAQMDDDPVPETVLLFSAHNGHYPYFDLFRNYYVIIDRYTGKIKYMSDVVVSTDREITLEDRNHDGKYELYRRYFKDGKFSTDEKGNKLSVTWMYDTIEFKN